MDPRPRSSPFFKRIAPSIIAILFVASGLLVVLPAIPAAHASGPTTVATLGGSSYFAATFNRPLCISNGYTFVFYSSGGAGTLQDYQSSANGVTWGSATSTGATVSWGSAAFSVYCDPSSSNIYMAWSVGNSFDYQQATTSGGVITLVGSVATIACTHGTCGSNGMSVYCFDSSHCGAVMSSSSGTFDENWLCSTTCSTNTNWSDKLVDSTNNCAFGCNMFGMDANNHWCSVEFTNPQPQAVQCTVNGGTSWSTFQSANNYYSGAACAKISSTTIGCGQLDASTHTKLYFNTYIIGTGAWTETQEGTIVASASAVSTSTDGSGNVYLTWMDSSTTGLDQLVSSNSGSTWGSIATYVSGEATALLTFSTSSTLTLGAPAVCWLLQTSLNLRCGANGTLPIVTTTTSVVTTVTATATATVGQLGGTPANATHFQLATNQMYVAYTQNPVNQIAVVNNITLKIYAVTVKSSTATLRLGVYLVTTPGQVPSSTYPLVLQSPTFAVQLANNSGTQFVHIPTASLQAIQLTICGSCYYGIGVVADSNGTAGGLSGIYVFGSSFANQVQIPNLYNPFAPVGGPYQPGWACIPAPEVSSTDPVPSNWYTYPSQPRCYELAYALFTQYSVNVVVRAGSTTTVTTNQGTITSTVTVSGTTTLTTTTEDAQTAAQVGGVYLFILLSVMGGLFFFGLYFGGLGGGIFGAIIGVVIGIASGIITGQYATLAVVSTLVGAVAAIQLGRGRRFGAGGL